MPRDTVVWVVGDVHGQDDLLEALVPVIAADLRLTPENRRVLIFLGDYIDRGLGSKRVVERVLGLGKSLKAEGAELIALMGNHEDLLLRFLDQPETGPDWFSVGGRETLLSYGVKPSTGTAETGDWERIAQNLLSALPKAHLAFYRSLVPSHTEGDFHFVHAGVRPGIPLDQQRADDMMWIREAFHKDPRPFEKMIVHGHTPSPEVYADGRRICLDTGSYATGVLTGLRLQAGTHILLQTLRTRGIVTLQSRSLNPI